MAEPQIPVEIPYIGYAPEAIASAVESGSETRATVIPGI